MQIVGCAETGNGCHRTSVDTLCGKDARMHRVSVDQYRAGTAVAGVAALLHLVVAVVAQERAQTLSGRRVAVDGLIVDSESHGNVHFVVADVPVEVRACEPRNPVG
jgi:hypothetical protein